MSLAPYFAVCGGIENITRTLLTEKDLMIEVRDKYLVQILN